MVAEEVEGTVEEEAEDAERVSDGVALRPERDFFSTKHLLHHQEGCSIRGQPLSLLTGGDIPVSSLQDPTIEEGPVLGRRPKKVVGLVLMGLFFQWRGSRVSDPGGGPGVPIHEA